jgi:hypothetical protein
MAETAGEAGRPADGTDRTIPEPTRVARDSDLYRMAKDRRPPRHSSIAAADAGQAHRLCAELGFLPSRAGEASADADDATAAD